MATFQVVIHQPHGLHERVHRGRAHKAPATLLQVLGHGDGCGRRGQGTRHFARDALRPFAGGGLVAPGVVRQRAELAPQLQHAARVVDGGLDLAPVAHDGRVLHQALDLGGAKGCDLLGVEVRERGAKALALVQDGEPAQAGLKTLQADLLEQPAVVRHRKAPLGVVVVAVQRRGLAPGATRATGFVSKQAVGQCGWASRVLSSRRGHARHSRKHHSQAADRASTKDSICP